MIKEAIDSNKMIQLLLDTSKFENLLKDMLTRIVTKKNQMWHSHQDKCKYYMSEIAEFFAGKRNWQGEHEDPDLAEYFVKIANTIEAFEYKDTTRTGRKI